MVPTIHERFRVGRILSGLSQTALAEKLGIKQSNIVRWERSQTPPRYMVTATSEATGIPASWYEDGILEGVVACRPMLPGIPYPRNAVNSIAHTLGRLVPIFMGPVAAPIAKLSVLKSSIGSVLCLSSESSCLVLFCIDTVAETLEYNLRWSSRLVEIRDDDFLNAFIQPELDYLKRILTLAALPTWAETVPEGKEVSILPEFLAEVRFRFVDRPGNDYAKAHITQLLDEFRAVLLSAGCTDVNYALTPKQGQGIQVENAPPGYIFKRLEPLRECCR